MFGSYSGGPPSLFTMAAPGGGQPSATSTRPATNLGFWRAPNRPVTTQHHHHHQGQYGSPFYPTQAPQRWLAPAMADPAGWAGNLATSKLVAGFQEHNLLSFSWVIKDLRLLREEVENSPASSLDEAGRSVSAGAGRSEIWTTQPLFGDGKWKLELVRTSRDGTTVLSAYLTSMVIESGAQDASLTASVMLGIRLPSTAQPSTSSGWVWSHFTHFTFDRDAEFFECHELPSLSELLNQHAEVAKANCFELVVQLGTGPHLAIPSEDAPTRRLPFQLPESRFVPDSIVAGLEGMVDSATTGDVALIVRERGVVLLASDEEVGPDFEVLPWAVGKPMPGTITREDVAAEAAGGEDTDATNHAHGRTDSDGSEGRSAEVVVRDRVIWAHSSILRSRSDYFRTMLDSGFSEGSAVGGGEDTMTSYGGRTVRVLRIPDADYATAFALVRYFYVGEIDFMEDEDVRSVTFDDEWATAVSGSSAPGISNSGNPVWEWRSLAQIAGELGQDYHHHHGSSSQDSFGALRASTSSSNLSSGRKSWGQATSSMDNRSDGASTPRHHRSGSSASNASSSNALTPEGATSMSLSSQAGPSSSPSSSLLASLLQSDPHNHPPSGIPPSPSASSLAIYKLAHRFHQTTLSSLAQAHLLATLHPARNAFPALLATHLYPTLHAAVRDAVLEAWGEVSESKEFERCCDEVGQGEWGVHAGRAIRGFMRALADHNGGASGNGSSISSRGGARDGSRSMAGRA